MNMDFENKIMDQIRSGRVKMRSKYIFVLKKIAFGSGFILSLLLAVFFANLLTYHIKESGNLSYFDFGMSGFLPFVESFPYFLLFAVVIFILVSIYFIFKNRLIYKQPFAYTAIALILFITLSGNVMASTGMNNRIEERIDNNQRGSIIFRPFYNRNIRNIIHGIIGQAVSIEDEFITIDSPNGEKQIKIILSARFSSDVASNINDLGIKEGDIIVAIGKRAGEDFMAIKIKKTHIKAGVLQRRILLNIQKRKCDYNQDGFVSRREYISCLKNNLPARGK